MNFLALFVFLSQPKEGIYYDYSEIPKKKWWGDKSKFIITYKRPGIGRDIIKTRQYVGYGHSESERASNARSQHQFLYPSTIITKIAEISEIKPQNSEIYLKNLNSSSKKIQNQNSLKN